MPTEEVKHEELNLKTDERRRFYGEKGQEFLRRLAEEVKELEKKNR